MSKKISDLPVVTDLTATDSFVMLDPEGTAGAKTKRATLEKIAAYVVGQVPAPSGGGGGPAGITQAQLDTALSTKADASALAAKADASALAGKADASALTFKADKAQVDALASSLAAKADATAVNAKADATTVTALSGTVANLQTAVNGKASAAQVDTVSNALAAMKASSPSYGAPTGVATRTGFDTATVTLVQVAERMKALLDDLAQKGILAYFASQPPPVVPGNPDQSTITNVPFGVPTKATTGYRGTLQPATGITTNTAAAVYRSGTTITVTSNATLQGYNLEGYNVVIQGANNSILDCAFDAAIGNTTIIINTGNTAAINNTIEYCTFDGKKVANNAHGQSIFFDPRTSQKSVSFNQFLNLPSDAVTFGGHIAKAYWNYIEGLGWRSGSHPDAFTKNGGYSGEPETVISYNYIDLLGPENRVLGANAALKIADNADARGNVWFHRNVIRGGSNQHQINVALINADVVFSENYRWLIGGQPVYDTQLNTDPNPPHHWGGPYGAFEGATYSDTSGRIMISDEIEIRNGLPAKEVTATGIQTSQLVEKQGTGRPGKVTVNSISQSGAFSIQAASGATSYQYRTSVANSGEFNAWQTLTTTGSGTLTGTLTLISNTINHVYIRAVNASGPGQPSKCTQIASGTVINAAPAWTTVPVLQGTAQEGQVLSTTQGVMSGQPNPTPSYQWERDAGGNGVASPISGAISGSYTVANADIGNRVRRTSTASNGVGSPAVTSTAWSSAVIAAVGTVPPTATIQYTSQGTVGTSQINTGSGANILSATAAAPSGTGGLLLLGVHFSSVVTADIPTPSGWTRQAGYDFFGTDGIVVFSKPGGLSDGAVTIQTPDERQGDRIICQQFRFTGGSASVESATAEFGTEIGNHPLNAAGANRLSVIFWSNERDAVNKGSIVGSPPTGYTELAETATTTTDTFNPTFAVDVKNALTTGAGNVTPGARAWASTPERQSFVHLLLF